MAPANVHPKTAGAAVGVGIGGAVVAVLQACGVHVPAELAAALSSLLSAVLAYLAPSPDPAPAALTRPQAPPETPNPAPVPFVFDESLPPGTIVGQPRGDQLPWRSAAN